MPIVTKQNQCRSASACPRNVRLKPALVCIALLLAGVSRATAQDAATLQNEISDLKEGQKAIQKDLQEIKELLKKTATAGNLPATLPKTMDAAGVLVKGDAKAPVTVIEFTDMQCPFCSRHALNTFPQIDNEYVKSGRVRYVVKDFPLESLHANAFKAAEANYCAAEQGRAWDMHDREMANQQKLTDEDLVGYSDVMGLDAAKFKACLASGKYAAAIRKEMAEGQAAGITGTPSFVLGVSDPASGHMTPEKTLSGAVAFSSFKAAIDDLLAKRQGGE